MDSSPCLSNYEHAPENYGAWMIIFLETAQKWRLILFWLHRD